MNQNGNTQNSIDYNLEETGKLLTQSKPEGKKKRIIIIAAVALIAVVLIGIFGIRALNEKRYNDKVTVAEKAMQEGDYAQAEAAYLEAVDMNKREPKAREGLAYAYAMQDKFEEAQKEYESLYKDTGDEKYQVAADDAGQGRTPANSDLAVETPWRQISLEDAPYPVAMESFVRTTAWYPNSDYCYDSPSVPGEFVLLEMLDLLGGRNGILMTPADEINGEDKYKSPWEAYGVDGWDNQSLPWEPDPRGLFESPYLVCDQEQLEKYFRDIFQFSDEAIEALRKSGGKDTMYYVQDGKYYKYYPFGGDTPIGIPFTGDTQVNTIWTNGRMYCVKYNSIMPNYNEDGSDFVDEYYELLELKTIDGRPYWTMSYNGPEMPKEVKITGMSNDGKDEKDKNDSEELKNRITGVWGAMSEEYHFNEDGSFYVPSPELNISADGEDLPDIHGTWYVDNGAIYVEFNDKKIKYTYDADNDLLMDEYGTSLSRVN